jgi:hypothetical protein
MDIVTNEIKTTQIERERYLLDHPQRLGILPTWWFWSCRENWRWIRWPFAMLVAALVVGLILLKVPLVVGLPVYAAVYIVALGAVEKYIRHQAMKRRALAERERPDSRLSTPD